MPVTQLAKYEDLLAYLDENNVPHTKKPEQLAVEVPVAPPLTGLVYVRWEKTLPYLQIVFPFGGEVPEARVAEVESAICHANTSVALPGFGFEYVKRFIYMRLCVPVYDGITPAHFQRQVLGVLQNAKEFVAAFGDVAVGGKPGKDILALAQAHNRPPS